MYNVNDDFARYTELVGQMYGTVHLIMTFVSISNRHNLVRSKL